MKEKTMGKVKLSHQICKKCTMLSEFYENTKKTNRDYWLMTEVFVLLHGGDTCEERKGMSIKGGKMITAILEDNKGFRMSYNLAKLKGKIRIPIHQGLQVINKNEVTVESLLTKAMDFRFYKWLEEGKIALYRES